MSLTADTPAIRAQNAADEVARAYLPVGMPNPRITATVADPVLEQRFGRLWWIAFVAASGLTVTMIVSLVWLVWQGVGIWGINTTNVWGFAIANYVWWIGIGNAGTLISSMLLLTRQRWRASISRFAEAMTLFAAAIAGLFPIFHLGRPWFFFWLVPYPNTMDLMPQWRSPLVWDFFAIASYLIFSLLFWYTGALPDFATMRDKAKGRIGRKIYGAFALGWRGSARHWHHYEAYYRAMAALGVPLVVSVHSVVGMDFAAGVMSGWNETIFPPYFVVGAMFSGFAMVVVLAALIRRGLGLHDLITMNHFDVMARILLVASLIMSISYVTEWFFAWYSGDYSERFVTWFEFQGIYAPFYWTMLACNCLFPLLYAFRAARRSLPIVIAVAILINVGMWLERILIISETLSRGHLPSQWRVYVPTIWDWLLLAGTLGFFAWMFLLFVRLVPAVSIHEVKERTREAEA
ncbi:polysulfide reductase NrfD [Oceaniovalibus guishaninsula JLT2003]|uniref:Polysulfide reductase NrfD n=1 Tax=Oceaniovalibus guishaninsula JLT2003 TaxID=1231392 RepID=K2I6K3_9RHOB|nr:NrfD/PsrC family molybdoenzyme membrane anchor subunit [Oceaniovalibus guishaninsula]EKE44610.1 polysulfide reductase NrfD [Oceaniovalibus guishaninsula JLT2003]